MSARLPYATEHFLDKNLTKELFERLESLSNMVNDPLQETIFMSKKDWSKSFKDRADSLKGVLEDYKKDETRDTKESQERHLKAYYRELLEGVSSMKEGHECLDFFSGSFAYDYRVDRLNYEDPSASSYKATAFNQGFPFKDAAILRSHNHMILSYHPLLEDVRKKDAKGYFQITEELVDDYVKTAENFQGLSHKGASELFRDLLDLNEKNKKHALNVESVFKGKETPLYTLTEDEPPKVVLNSPSGKKFLEGLNKNINRQERDYSYLLNGDEALSYLKDSYYFLNKVPAKDLEETKLKNALLDKEEDVLTALDPILMKTTFSAYKGMVQEATTYFDKATTTGFYENEMKEVLSPTRAYKILYDEKYEVSKRHFKEVRTSFEAKFTDMKNSSGLTEEESYEV